MYTPRLHSLYPPSLSAGVAASGRHRNHLMPGAPYNISTNDCSLRPVVLDAAYFYNNKSNDAFLFRPSGVLAAQRQVTGTGNRWSAAQQATTRKCLNFLLVVLSGGQGPQILGGPGDLQNCLPQTSLRQPHQLRLPACRAALPGEFQQRVPPPWVSHVKKASSFLSFQVLRCHFDFWMIPWLHKVENRVLTCTWTWTSTSIEAQPNRKLFIKIHLCDKADLLNRLLLSADQTPHWSGGVTTATHCSQSAGKTIKKKRRTDPPIERCCDGLKQH